MSSWHGCWPLPMRPGSLTGPWRWIPPSLVPISTPRTSPVTQGAGSNYTNLGIEPPDHGVGRSRGGLTSKIHHLVDGHGRPLVVLVSAGHAPLFEHLLAHLKVTRGSAGAPRTLRDRVRADKAYSSRAIRAELRRRGITAVIPEPSDQIAHRKRRGSRWPATSFRRRRLQGRNVIERGFNTTKQWRGL